MKKKDIEQLKSKNLTELKQLLKEEKDTLFRLRVDNMRRKLENTSSLATTRAGIARILSFMREKEVQNHG